MSAFQVAPAHVARIVAIADALRCGGVNRHPSPYVGFCGMDAGYSDTNPRIFAALAKANADSVGSRYSEVVEPVPYEEPRSVRLDTATEIIAAIKVLDCYVYQSSEAPGWERSTVGRWCAQLRDVLVRSLPGFEAAYREAAWSLTSQVAA